MWERFVLDAGLMHEQPVIIAGRMGGIGYISRQTKRNRTVRGIRPGILIALGPNGPSTPPPEKEKRMPAPIMPRFLSFSFFNRNYP